jgi:hypothetical protein
MTMHLGGNHEFSTFRLTLGAILAEATGAARIDEMRLTQWMKDHLRIVTIPFEDSDVLGRLERDVLERLDPPLNLQGMQPTPVRHRLRELRHAIVNPAPLTAEELVVVQSPFPRTIGDKVSGNPRAAEFDDELFERICSAVKPDDEIATLSNKRLNRIAAVDRSGVFVETARSGDRGTGPQLVPAWMIIAGWHHLCRRGELIQEELLNDLNVKRSAFVCALLAQFSDVVVRATRPTVLELVRGRANGGERD